MCIIGRPSLAAAGTVESKPLVKKRNWSAQIEWTKKLLCNHAGNYRDQQNPNVSPSKNRPNCQHNLIKSRCMGYIWLQKKIDIDEVHIEYFWQHTGHTVGSLKDLCELCIPCIVSNQIDELVHSGMDWRSIKCLLTVDEEVLESISLYIHIWHILWTCKLLSCFSD